MRVNNINNQPNFQARLIVNDARVDKFIDASKYRYKGQTAELMKKLALVHPDTSISLRLSGFEDDAKLIASNLKNQKSEIYNLDALSAVTKNDEKAFINLISRLLDEGSAKAKEFWA